MDPKTALDNLRYYLNRTRELSKEPTRMTNTQVQEMIGCCEEAVEAFDALDAWMTKGGFSPWRP